VGAAVIPPVLELLYNAYGFAGALPRAGMDPGQALAAPQATLMTAIATGIFTHKLNWTMILIGIALGVVLIAIDEVLRRRRGSARLPVLAVGIGIYLPPTISSALVVGAVLAWCLLRAERRRATARGDDVRLALAHAERRGTLLASGLIVGESLVGVLLAADRPVRHGCAAGRGGRRLCRHGRMARAGSVRAGVRGVLPPRAGRGALT
jgi:putative OPT family oligopeptide transporter